MFRLADTTTTEIIDIRVFSVLKETANGVRGIKVDDKALNITCGIFYISTVSF